MISFLNFGNGLFDSCSLKEEPTIIQALCHVGLHISSDENT